MISIQRRLEKLERQSTAASASPSEAEWREALALHDRYSRLWGTPQFMAGRPV